MHFSIADRTITLNAREFAQFSTIPSQRDAGRPEIWRAQLGQL